MAFRVLGPFTQFFSLSGALLGGGTLNFYETGTLTPKATYNSSALSVANSNPITLPTSGIPAVDIWGSGTYRVIIKTAAGATIFDEDVLDPAAQAVAPVENVTALRALTGLLDGQRIDMAGYHSTAVNLNPDGGGGPLIYRASSTATVDNFRVFAATGMGGVGRFHRDFSGVIPDVRMAGAKFDGTTDDTAAHVAALAAVDEIKWPVGTTVISSLTIVAGKRIRTAGFSTIVQQKSGQAVGTRLLVVTGSNVEIGGLKIIGNISTDTDEQQHGIFVRANSTNGSIENVIIGDVIGKNIRGDVVYVGHTSNTYPLKNVRIGNVICDNVYRNGVSVVGGDGIEIASVTGTQVGFCHLDVEPNAGGGTATNVRCGYVKGRLLGVNSQTAADYCDQIQIDIADLSPSHAAQSSPSYAVGAAINDGLLLRNVKRMKIGLLKIEGFNRCAAFITYNAGELGVEDLQIDSLYIRNCSITDTTYNSYIQWNSVSGPLRIGHLDVVITGSNKRVIDSAKDGEIRSIKADVQASAALLRNCDDMIVSDFDQSGANGIMLNACNRIICKNGTFTGDRLTSGSARCDFENVTATAAVALFVSGDDHFARNSTLNSTFYGAGRTVGGYQPFGRKVSVPSTATTSGSPGDWAADTSYYYTYTGDGTTHTWRRVAVAVW